MCHVVLTAQTNNHGEVIQHSQADDVIANYSVLSSHVAWKQVHVTVQTEQHQRETFVLFHFTAVQVEVARGQSNKASFWSKNLQKTKNKNERIKTVGHQKLGEFCRKAFLNQTFGCSWSICHPSIRCLLALAGLCRVCFCSFVWFYCVRANHQLHLVLGLNFKGRWNPQFRH